MSLNGWKALVYSVAVGLCLWAVSIAGCVTSPVNAGVSPIWWRIVSVHLLTYTV